MHFLKRCQKMGRATPCLRETVACCEHAKVSPQAKVGTSPFLNAALRTVWTDDVGALLWWFARSRWWIFAAFDSQRSRYITGDLSIMMIYTFIGQDLNTRHNKEFEITSRWPIRWEAMIRSAPVLFLGPQRMDLLHYLCLVRLPARISPPPPPSPPCCCCCCSCWSSGGAGLLQMIIRRG